MWHWLVTVNLRVVICAGGCWRRSDGRSFGKVRNVTGSAVTADGSVWRKTFSHARDALGKFYKPGKTTFTTKYNKGESALKPVYHNRNSLRSSYRRSLTTMSTSNPLDSYICKSKVFIQNIVRFYLTLPYHLIFF